MLSFLSRNIGSITVLAVLILVAILIVVFRIRARRQGKSGCNCGCSTCPMAGKCHPNKSEKEQDTP